MNKKERQILEEELLYPPSRGEYSDDYPAPRIVGGRERRSRREMGQHLKDDLRKVFRAVDTAYKIPDRISKGVGGFCDSFGKAFGNKKRSRR
ncbi:MAG: hypothetical protein JRE40_14960 [Deltaproteobacteria bacterium]|nr:hypothetical protein [Deltaproteobacteria bacterium]